LSGNKYAATVVQSLFSRRAEPLTAQNETVSELAKKEKYIKMQDMRGSSLINRVHQN